MPATEKFAVLNRWTGEVQFTAEIECSALSNALREAFDEEADCLRRLRLARKQLIAAREKRKAIEAGEGAR